MALNARSPGERSITLAIFIMAANCSGIVGSQLFQQDDGPLYRVGWTAIVSIVSVALFLTIWLNVQYRLLNWRLKKQGRLNESTNTTTESYWSAPSVFRRNLLEKVGNRMRPETACSP